jgi:hypothetical protein
VTAPAPPTPRIAPLFDGRIDVVGDVHGEIDALVRLLQVLGYDADGRHRERRRLVFVGDLCDRGPDSPAVFALVQRLHATGRAQCVLGNHELNVLRGAAKHGNGWFFDDDHDRAQGRFPQSRRAVAGERDAILRFVASLPVALVRDDLRVVHAAWHEPSLRRFETDLSALPYLELYESFATDAVEVQERARLAQAAAEERAPYEHRLTDRNADVPLLVNVGACDVHYQMSNPLRVVTSGVEQLAARPFYASGKWRMVDRIPWWHDYAAGPPVVFGHYWRWPDEATRVAYVGEGPDLFAGTAPNEWLGPHRNAFCADFSVGIRYVERRERPAGPWTSRLAAVRWPEGALAFDDGYVVGLA